METDEVSDPADGQPPAKVPKQDTENPDGMDESCDTAKCPGKIAHAVHEQPIDNDSLMDEHYAPPIAIPDSDLQGNVVNGFEPYDDIGYEEAPIVQPIGIINQDLAVNIRDVRAAVADSTLFSIMHEDLIRAVILRCAKRDKASLRETCMIFNMSPPQKFYNGHIVFFENSFFLQEGAGKAERRSFMSSSDDSLEGLHEMVGNADLASFSINCALSESFLISAENTVFTTKSLVLMSISTVHSSDDRIYTPAARQHMLRRQRRRGVGVVQIGHPGQGDGQVANRPVRNVVAGNDVRDGGIVIAGNGVRDGRVVVIQIDDDSEYEYYDDPLVPIDFPLHPHLRNLLRRPVAAALRADANGRAMAAHPHDNQVDDLPRQANANDVNPPPVRVAGRNRRRRAQNPRPPMPDGYRAYMDILADQEAARAGYQALGAAAPNRPIQGAPNCPIQGAPNRPIQGAPNRPLQGAGLLAEEVGGEMEEPEAAADRLARYFQEREWIMDHDGEDEEHRQGPPQNRGGMFPGYGDADRGSPPPFDAFFDEDDPYGRYDAEHILGRINQLRQRQQRANGGFVANGVRVTADDIADPNFPYTREELTRYDFIEANADNALHAHVERRNAEWIQRRAVMEERIRRYREAGARQNSPPPQRPRNAVNRMAARRGIPEGPDGEPIYHLSTQTLDDKIEAFIRLIVKWQPETIEVWDGVFPELARRIVDDFPYRVTKMHIASWNKDCDILRKMPLIDVSVGHIPPHVDGVEECINKMIEEWLFAKREKMGRWKLGHTGYILIADRLFQSIPPRNIINKGFGEFLIKRDFRDLTVTMGLNSISLEDKETASEFDMPSDEALADYEYEDNQGQDFFDEDDVDYSSNDMEDQTESD